MYMMKYSILTRLTMFGAMFGAMKYSISTSGAMFGAEWRLCAIVSPIFSI